MSKTKKKAAKNKTVVSEEKQGKFEYYVTNAVCVILFILFAYITVISFIQTSVIDPAKYASEVILYQNDAVILNLLLTAAFIAFLFLTKRLYNFFAKNKYKIYGNRTCGICSDTWVYVDIICNVCSRCRQSKYF